MTLATIRDFLRHEAVGGLLLLAAALLALVMANSGLADLYAGLLDVPMIVQIGALTLAKPLLLWINDGLMAIFFFLVGLEIKREVLDGELSSARQAALPAIAAVGGMAVPALIYILINAGDPYALRGWAIPAATDIAFSLGVLALLGGRVPLQLKVFLLALAILDDLGAIIVIALFYTAGLSWLALGLAGAGVVGLVLLNRLGVTRLIGYVVIGLFIWVCVLKSGVHATLAGVVLAFSIPLRAADEHGHSPLRRLEHVLHPWVAYGILPLFAFANAGVSLGGLTPAILIEPVPLGIAAGLVLGKPLGVLAFSWLAGRLGWARLPAGVGWPAFAGVACLTGIGFTMSLFIGTLAFLDAASATDVRLGVLAGSLLSALLGYGLLRFALGRGPAPMGAAAGAPGR